MNPLWFVAFAIWGTAGMLFLWLGIIKAVDWLREFLNS